MPSGSSRGLIAGAIGRRRLGPGADEGVARAVRQVLAALSAGAGTVVSPLAEGADQLIASTALDAGWRIGAVLPFDRTAYAATFDLEDADAARAELQRLLQAAEAPGGWGVIELGGGGSSGGRDQAFMDCASWIIRQADVLLAAFEADDVSSQTALSAAEALQLGRPVVRLDAAAPWGLELRLGAERLRGEDALHRLGDLGASPAADRRHRGNGPG
jgi:hypothetical protein